MGSVAAIACLLAAMHTPAYAQDVSGLAGNIPAGSQMLLESDVLTYDQDNNTVTASGRVRIEYGGNKLVAERVVYDRKTGRLKALGNVEIVESAGNRIYSQEIDITDDFADGFVNQLRVETPEKTYFAAESANRQGGKVTTFYNGVYTACEPCEEKPDKAPIWRIKARKTIWNGEKKTIRFEDSRFEMFGLPIAYMPVFEVPDPTVKRKSGFLIPSIDYSKYRGVGVHVPYYFALSPTYDLTVTGHGYTKQGFMPEAVWRQRFNNGQYSVTVAGISQMKPGAWPLASADPNYPYYYVGRGPLGDKNRLRGMVGTNGHFDINPRWAFGWNLLLQSDKNFAKSYDVSNYKSSVFRNEVYLTGMGERNYFDLRFMKFKSQDDLDYAHDGITINKGKPEQFQYYALRDGTEPWVLPSFDYNAVKDEPVAGGQLSFNLNSRTIVREKMHRAMRLDRDKYGPNAPGYDTTAIRGAEGSDSRLTGEAEWKRDIITPGGLVVTPLLHVQAEARVANQSDSTVAAIHNMAGFHGVADDIRSSWNRYMATAGLEVKWPVLFSMTGSTHVVEPMAQIFARPDEQYVGGLGLSNEDAQSFVFDASSLFDRDKFSGYDRMEGGTRGNFGVRYSGTYANGWTSQALFGQSYQIAGQNSFASPDFVNAGAESGLETKRSDFVGMVGFSTPWGVSAALSSRMDEKTFDPRRTEASVGFVGENLSAKVKYAFIAAQPNYGQPDDRHEIGLNGRVRVNENWTAFGSGTYDIKNDFVSRKGIGFGYADDCFTFTLTYENTKSLNTATNKFDSDQKFGFNLSFRTLADIGTTSSAFTQ